MGIFKDSYGPNDPLPDMTDRFPEGMRPVGDDDDGEERVHRELAPRLRKYPRNGHAIIDYNVEINRSRVGDMLVSPRGARVKFVGSTDFVDFPDADAAEKAFIQKWKDEHKPYSALALKLLGKRCTLDGMAAEIVGVHRRMGCVEHLDEMGGYIRVPWGKIEQIINERGGTFTQEDDKQ